MSDLERKYLLQKINRLQRENESLKKERNFLVCKYNNLVRGICDIRLKYHMCVKECNDNLMYHVTRKQAFNAFIKDITNMLNFTNIRLQEDNNKHEYKYVRYTQRTRT